jgi:predicted deacylase
MSEKVYEQREFTDLNGKSFLVKYCKIAGTAPGPVLTLIAGQHGMEHSGPNVLAEFIDEIANEEFAGTLYICPCANPAALELDYECYPEDHDLSKLDDYYYSQFRHTYCPFGLGRQKTQSWYNMNRLWNRGDDIHGMAGEIASWLWDEICRPANVIIDMHSLQADKPLIFTGSPINYNIAKYFGIECVRIIDQNPDDYRIHNLLYQVNKGLDARGFCVEFSRQHGLKESEYDLAKKGIRNTMKAMNMLAGSVIHERPVWGVLEDDVIIFTASHTGHIRYYFNQYDTVKKGDKLYAIRDIQTLDILEEEFSPIDGIFSGNDFRAVTAPGQPTCRLALATQLAPANTALPISANYEDNIK